eukprot:scaffold651546_cov37-Prasinocladus_malaysianus.AAC.1
MAKAGEQVAGQRCSGVVVHVDEVPDGHGEGELLQDGPAELRPAGEPRQQHQRPPPAVIRHGGKHGPQLVGVLGREDVVA